MPPKTRKAVKKPAKPEEPIVQKPMVGYLGEDKLRRGVLALKKYVKVQSREPSTSNGHPEEAKPKKSLLDAGQEDSSEMSKVILEVVFKNIPSNSKTYIHNALLPHHWRKTLEPEHYDIALIVRHRKPANEAEKIQFERDRELDIDNTHSYYKELLEKRLSEPNRARISRIITTKEIATEFNTHQKIDRLSKTYDLFIADKKLVVNKFDALLRRLGRRFWVREKKVPLSIKLEAKNLDERFGRAMSIEPFYVLGRSTTEKIQVGLINQKAEHITENIQAFLDKLYLLYGDNVRFLKLRTNKGLALTLFADLATQVPKEVKMNKKRIKPSPIEGDFDFLRDDQRLKINPSGLVKVIKPSVKTKRKVEDSSVLEVVEKPTKRIKKK